MSVELTREQLAGVRAVSFDLDGTLYELPAMKRAVRWLAIGRAWRPLRVAGELRRLLRARAAYQQAREAGGDLSALPGIDSPEVLRALEARWWVPAIGAAGPRAGIPELLEALGASGLPLVVCSDHEGQGKLEALGLARRFQALYAGETLGALKPSPRVLEAALEALGLEPSELLHIGDRDDTDGAAARALGARVWILPSEGAVALAPTALADHPGS